MERKKNRTAKGLRVGKTPSSTNKSINQNIQCFNVHRQVVPTPYWLTCGNAARGS